MKKQSIKFKKSDYSTRLSYQTDMHGNSIEIDHDDNLIISDRRSSQIIKIDRLAFYASKNLKNIFLIH